MAVRIKISKSQVAAKISNAWDRGLSVLSEEILSDCNEYCKEDQRTLIMSSLAHSRPSEGKLVWQTPYARRQYWDIKTSLTPGRTWRWCETAKRNHKSKWEKVAQKCLEDNL